MNAVCCRYAMVLSELESVDVSKQKAQSPSLEHHTMTSSSKELKRMAFTGYNHRDLTLSFRYKLWKQEKRQS